LTDLAGERLPSFPRRLAQAEPSQRLLWRLLRQGIPSACGFHVHVETDLFPAQGRVVRETRGDNPGGADPRADQGLAQSGRAGPMLARFPPDVDLRARRDQLAKRIGQAIDPNLIPSVDCLTLPAFAKPGVITKMGLQALEQVPGGNLLRS